jgi:hypothetical protein
MNIKSSLSGLIILAIIFPVFTSCNSSDSSYHNVKIEGVSWATNLSTSFASSGSVARVPGSYDLYLPVRDGDLLYAMSEEEEEIFYRYSTRDGDILSVTFDTAGASSARINGTLAFFELTHKKNSWNRFRNLSTAEVEQLSTLYIPDQLNGEILELLRLHSSYLAGTNLLLEEILGEEILHEALALCRPQWLGLAEPVELRTRTKTSYLAGLQLLWITENLHAFYPALECCTNLQALIITNWSPGEGELLPLAHLKNMYSLTLAECELDDLRVIELPSGLQRLHLVGYDSLTSLGGVGKLSGLESLSLSGCVVQEDMDLPDKMKPVTWYSFPANITQSQFQSTLARQNKLEVLELNFCDGISDLSPVAKLQGLRTLIYHAEEFPAKQLAQLAQPDLMILSSEWFDSDPEKISWLREQLPETDIVAGSGLCLGSGWLILMLPLIWISYRLFQRKTGRLFRQ